MAFKLNIGKDGGGGSTGFSLNQSLNMIKAKGMSSQMIGTDVMKDGYYNTVNESGAGSPNNFNKKLKKESASGGLNDSPEFKAAVDASGEGMPMNEMAYKLDGGIYQTDNTYTKTEEKEGYMGRGVTRGGKMPEVGDTFTSDDDARQTSTKTTVTDQNNSPRSTPAVRGKGVKVNRTINKSVKDDRKYYPQNHPKAGQIIP